ncbi:VOC family protein [Streptomyces sp. NBC_01341]|uniref:VOC family protein n=1 Tax=Streptomyces sp. NBC_01341 TaxID=2903831 RepID=UPI002E130A11|nr:VOC family protein [Streptomyces sp. NBC_01341]
MALHRLTDITLGVPNVEETVEYYTAFGLIPEPSDNENEHWFGTVDGGRRQLRIVHAPIRRLLALGVGADDRDDLGRIESSLRRSDTAVTVEGDQLRTREPVTGLTVNVTVAPHIEQQSTPAGPFNTPGTIGRPNARAASLLRSGPVRPRKLGHISLGSTDVATTQRFFTEDIGFKVSDEVKDFGAFMRCSSDHHNLAVQAAPVPFMHHSSWEVDDVDEIGRGAESLLADHPERHTWGLGRHWVGANYFYYFRDPAGNLSEYYSDMDQITDDELWNPGVFDLQAGNFWGPPLPPSMIEPEDLAELMAGLH